MKQMKTYKLRIYPNKDQIQLIHQTFGCCRFVFNYSLSRQKAKEELWYTVEQMVQNGQLPQNNWKSDFFKKNEAIKAIRELKVNHPFLKEVDSIALQESVERLHKAYDRSYKKLGGRPKFKSKRNLVQSFTTKCVNGNISIEGNMIKLPKLGRLKFKDSRSIEGTIKTATVTKSPSGKYFISLTAETEIMPLPKLNTKVGIDVGIKEFAVCSNGLRIPNPKHYQKKQQRLAFLQKALARKKRGSRNYEKQRLKVAKCHENIFNQRKDFLHKCSTQLIRENQSIAIEHLNVTKMLKEKDLAQAIAQAAWYEFRLQLEYKSNGYDRTLVVADPHYPSSQLCSTCGDQNPLVKNLNVRHWTCPTCSTLHDRDYNASLNLVKLIA